uniref:Interferon alpha n=1 Tax=Strigops habroptila TaxID=2489341 RepID=A0A672VBL9_STRHB
SCRPAAPPAQRPPAPPTSLSRLLTTLATGLACHLRPPRDATFPWRSLQLLRDMAPSPTPPCHHHQAPVFPDTLLHNSHPQQAAATALRILQHLFHTLSSPSTPHNWHNDARHQLLNGLQHRIQRLQHCLPDNATLFPGQGPRNALLTINKYFRHIQDFLRAHNHSACAWDHVRLEARLCFQHLDTPTPAPLGQRPHTPTSGLTHPRQEPSRHTHRPRSSFLLPSSLTSEV